MQSAIQSNMANQLYGYNPSSNAGIAAGSNLSRTTTRSMDDYLSTDNNKPFLGSSSYFGSSGYSFSSPTMLFNQSDSYNPAASKIPGLAAYQSSWTAPPGVDVAQPPAADSYFSSLKRSSSDGKGQFSLSFYLSILCLMNYSCI